MSCGLDPSKLSRGLDQCEGFFFLFWMDECGFVGWMVVEQRWESRRSAGKGD